MQPRPAGAAPAASAAAAAAGAAPAPEGPPDGSLNDDVLRECERQEAEDAAAAASAAAPAAGPSAGGGGGGGAGGAGAAGPPAEAVVRGDGTVACIAAASVIAKARRGAPVHAACGARRIPWRPGPLPAASGPPPQRRPRSVLRAPRTARPRHAPRAAPVRRRPASASASHPDHPRRHQVTRDRIMVSLDAEFPGYGFAQHKVGGQVVGKLSDGEASGCGEASRRAPPLLAHGASRPSRLGRAARSPRPPRGRPSVRT
jgi:hypothetical protein